MQCKKVLQPLFKVFRNKAGVFIFSMKNTLNELLRSSFTSSEMIMYKSDGPSRKLRILSDHWKSKAKENAEKSHAAGAPVEAEDSSTDHPAILASRSRTPSSNQASSKLGTNT